MTVKITLDTANAAFYDANGDFWPEPEIVRILRRAADTIEREGLSAGFSLCDINGNAVGRVSVHGKRK